MGSVVITHIVTVVLLNVLYNPMVKKKKSVGLIRRSNYFAKIWLIFFRVCLDHQDPLESLENLVIR